MGTIQYDPKRKKIVIYVNGKQYPPANPNDPNDAELVAEEAAQAEEQRRKDAYQRAKRHVQSM